MSLKTLTFEASEESIATLDEIAANMETDRATVLRDALEMYLADYELEKTAAAEADRQFEAGETIAHEDVVKWFSAQHPVVSESEAA
jgi:predicted transcriptional regulator